MWKSRARAVRAACELSRARRVVSFSRPARMTAPTPPMLAATGAQYHRRAIQQFYTKRERVGIAVDVGVIGADGWTIGCASLPLRRLLGGFANPVAQWSRVAD